MCFLPRQAQARECLHEKALLGHSEDFETVVELSQEAANVAQEYAQVCSFGIFIPVVYRGRWMYSLLKISVISVSVIVP